MKKYVDMFAKSVSEGEIRPRGYGFAYYDIDYNRIVCYPLGIHLLVGFVRKVYHRFLSIRFKSVVDEAYKKGLNEGMKYSSDRYAEGMRHGLQDCMEILRKKEYEFDPITGRAKLED